MAYLNEQLCKLLMSYFYPATITIKHWKTTTFLHKPDPFTDVPTDYFIA